MVREIGDSVVAKDVEQLDVDSVGDTLKVEVARLSQPEREDRRNRDYNYY